MPIKHIVENCEIASKAVAEKVPCKWGNILSISIKTSQSVALPFYNKSPEEVSRIRKVAGSNGDAVVEKKKRKRQPQSKNPDIPGKETKSCDESSNSKEKVKKKISPLLKALKKQRLAEGLETEGGNEKKLNKAKNDGDDGQKHGKEKPLSKDAKVNNKSQSKTKRSKGSVSAVEDSILDARADNNTTKASSSPKIELSPIKAKEILHGCEKKGVRASKHALDKTEPAEESHAKKDRETIAASATTRPVVEKAVNSDDTDTTNEDFMSSKKFKGAKIGYVFKEGSQGVGYYVDMLPQVDKAALDAVLRKGGVSGKRGKKRRH